MSRKAGCVLLGMGLLSGSEKRKFEDSGMSGSSSARGRIGGLEIEPDPAATFFLLAARMTGYGLRQVIGIGNRICMLLLFFLAGC